MSGLEREGSPTPRVLHLVPIDLVRGAQTYARLLRDELDGVAGNHRTMTLFAGERGALAPDLSLGVPATMARRAGFDPQVFTRLRRRLVQLRPDVVVSHGGEPLKYAALACPSGARLVYYKIGAGAPELRSPARRVLYRALLRRTSAVAAVSEDAAAELEHLLGVPAAKTRVIPNGRDPEVFRPSAVTTRTSEAIRFLTVGHLDPGKRHRLFLDLLRSLRERGMTVEGVIAGDGPMEAELCLLAPSSGVTMLGRRHDVPALLASSDIFVLTSEAEGLPGVLIEAGLTGLPVITTDVPGARAVVLDGVTGFVVAVDDFDGLVEAAARLATRSDLRAAMGAAARAHCEEHFSMAASAAAWAELIDEVLDPSRPGGR